MWKDYFDFSKSQRRAIYLLLFLVVAMYAYAWYRFDNYEFRHDEHFAKREALHQFMEEREAALASYADSKPHSKTETLNIDPEYFLFNPNEASSEDWEKLGLRSYQIRNIQNYLKSGARFYHADDLDKLYSLKQTDLSELKKYVRIPADSNIVSETMEGKFEMAEKDPSIWEKEGENYESPDFSERFELNAALPADLEIIRGVGSVLSKRIIAYRTILGGFYSFEQLFEVYGLDSSVVEAFQTYADLDTSWIKKLDINYEKREVLSAHPYLRGPELDGILQYRARKGFIANPEMLLKDNVLDSSSYRKIRPYLQ